MDMWLQIILAIVLGMMLFRMYPAVKHWMENGPKAEKGDWSAAILPLLAVIGFIILLIAMVRM
jgi:archaellum biogenesis protein FlaJ (TadC family)